MAEPFQDHTLKRNKGGQRMTKQHRSRRPTDTERLDFVIEALGFQTWLKGWMLLAGKSTYWESGTGRDWIDDAMSEEKRDVE